MYSEWKLSLTWTFFPRFSLLFDRAKQSSQQERSVVSECPQLSKWTRTLLLCSLTLNLHLSKLWFHADLWLCCRFCKSGFIITWCEACWLRYIFISYIKYQSNNLLCNDLFCLCDQITLNWWHIFGVLLIKGTFKAFLVLSNWGLILL